MSPRLSALLLPQPSLCPSTWPFPTGAHLENTRQSTIGSEPCLPALEIKASIPRLEQNRGALCTSHTLRAELLSPSHPDLKDTHRLHHQCVRQTYPAASLLRHTCMHTDARACINTHTHMCMRTSPSIPPGLSRSGHTFYQDWK